MIHNKIDKLFGQAGSILGWIIILTGFYSSSTVFILLFIATGSFMAFSYSGIYINPISRTYKSYHAYFGILKTGSWKSMKNIDGIAGISPTIIRTSYLPKEKKVNVKMDDCFVVLFMKNRNRKIPFKRCKNLIDAKLEAQKTGKLLNLQVIP